MECRILTVGLAFASSLFWADRAIGANPANIDKIVDVAALYANHGTRQLDATLLSTNLPGSVDKLHVLKDGAIRINPFFDAPVANEGSIDTKVAQASTDREVKILARSDFSPFIDPDHPEGGVLVGIVWRAFEYAGYKPSLDFSGWEADSTDLRRVNILYPHDRNREAEYLYSAPVMNFEVRAYGYRDGDVSVRSVADLADRRVCASQALLTQAVHALGSAGDIDPIEDDLVSCFQGLLDGELDIVLAEVGIGELYVDELAIESRLTASDDVIDLGGLYVMIPKFSPYSSVMMYHLNESLTKMRQSGELKELLEVDEKRRSTFADDDAILRPKLTSPTEAENPATDHSRAPKGATM